MVVHWDRRFSVYDLLLLGSDPQRSLCQNRSLFAISFNDRQAVAVLRLVECRQGLPYVGRFVFRPLRLQPISNPVTLHGYLRNDGPSSGQSAPPVSSRSLSGAEQPDEKSSC